MDKTWRTHTDMGRLCIVASGKIYLCCLLRGLLHRERYSINIYTPCREMLNIERYSIHRDTLFRRILHQIHHTEGYCVHWDMLYTEIRHTEGYAIQRVTAYRGIYHKDSTEPRTLNMWGYCTSMLPRVVILTIISFSIIVFLRAFIAIFSDVNIFMNKQGTPKQSHVSLIWIAL